MGVKRETKSNDKITCLDIELAIMKYFDFRKNLIVPGITKMMLLLPFETDMLVLTKSNCAYGFEIKVTKSDLNNDFKKRQIKAITGTQLNGFNEPIPSTKGLIQFYYKFRHFYYAVPCYLEDYALEVIPEMFGVLSLHRHTASSITFNDLRVARKPKQLSTYKWSEKERYEVARLGAMRIWSLKNKIKQLTAYGHKN